MIRGDRDCLNIYGNDYDTPDGTGVRDYIHMAKDGNGVFSESSFVFIASSNRPGGT